MIGKLTPTVFVPDASLRESAWTWTTPPDWVAMVAVATAPGSILPQGVLWSSGVMGTVQFSFNFDVDSNGNFVFALDTANWPSLLDIAGCPPACPG